MTEPSPMQVVATRLVAALKPMIDAIDAHPLFGPLWRASIEVEKAKTRLRVDVHVHAPELDAVLARALEERDAATVGSLRRHVDRLTSGAQP